MKKRLCCLFLGVLMLAITACGPTAAAPETPAVSPTEAAAAPTPIPEPTPEPFPDSTCVRLRVKLSGGKERGYYLKLEQKTGRCTLRLLDYPGVVLEPGTEVFFDETGLTDLPFHRFLKLLREYHAEAWKGWETTGGEEGFVLELEFADGSTYAASGGEEPEGFGGFREAFIREMARFGEDWCGVEPQTLQERLLTVYPMDWNGGGMTDIYYCSNITLPLGERGIAYESPGYVTGKHDLSPFIGEWLFDHNEKSWYRVKGMKGVKYVISLDEEGKMRLWEYRWRNREDWEEVRSAAELLREVYAAEGPEDLRKIVDTQGRFRYPDPSLTRTIEDRESIEAFWAILSKLTWSGPPWEWKAYDFPEYTYSFTPEDGNWPPETESLSQRAITLVFADGTTMEDWHYNAVFGYLENAYGYAEYIQPDEPLSPEDVYTLNALFGIA